MGFTLIEIVIVVAIVAVLSAIAVPNYLSMKEKAIFNDTIVILRELSAKIDLWAMEEDRYPSTLAEAGLETIKDEWENDFIYNPFDTAVKKTLRKYKNEHPINTDYDLLSLGKDGLTDTNIQKNECDDDIIRANNGGFYGYGEDY
jgi:general secretion pathway protein G